MLEELVKNTEESILSSTTKVDLEGYKEVVEEYSVNQTGLRTVLYMMDGVSLMTKSYKVTNHFIDMLDRYKENKDLGVRIGIKLIDHIGKCKNKYTKLN